VRTDLRDGFRLDRGFQLFNPAYPEPPRLLDLERLDLRAFTRGVAVFRGGRRHRLLDPRSEPSSLLATLRAPIGSVRAKAAVAAMSLRDAIGPVGALITEDVSTRKTLERWGIYKDGDQPVNPVARTNVCPMYDKPSEPVMYAFSYTVPAKGSGGLLRGTFILSGSGDRRAGGKTFHESIVRYNNTSPEGLREKVDFVVTEMERRLRLLGFSWKDAVSTQVYTVQNIGHLVGEVLAARGAGEGGIVWTYSWPPVIGLEYEMDVRGAAREILV